MANPRIEEVEDDDELLASDPEEMDLDTFDFARPTGTLQGSAVRPNAPESSTMSPQALQSPMQQAGSTPQFNERERERLQREQQEKSKHFQCIYPVYFDATRSREDGRRVNKAQAVQNPLARDIVDALQHIGQKLQVPFQIVFEPTKTHPKDWANPGRVRVLLKTEGQPTNSKIGSKHYLYKLISEYLQAHPTTAESPLKFRIQGLPMPKDNKIPPPAIPRGFKIGQILPLHSPAMSGGGVSDNMLQDAMAAMGGQMPPGMNPDMLSMLGGMGGMGGGGAPSPGGSVKKVKDKKKK